MKLVFDYLVTGQVVPTNPASSVRGPGPKYVIRKGKTPVLSAEEARILLESIDVSTVVGLRDRFAHPVDAAMREALMCPPSWAFVIGHSLAPCFTVSPASRPWWALPCRTITHKAKDRGSDFTRKVENFMKSPAITRLRNTWMLIWMRRFSGTVRLDRVVIPGHDFKFKKSAK